MTFRGLLGAAILAILLPRQVPSSAKGRVLSARPFTDRRITESSGMVASRTHPGWLWTMNDSGGDAVLFLTDTTGASLAALTVPGAVNLDWEALGRGPCGPLECLYIGDTGDNGATRPTLSLYRIPEPSPADTAGRVTARAAGLEIRLASGPRDVEALYVRPDGTTVLVTKGMDGVVIELAVPPTAWERRGTFTASITDTLPIQARLGTGRVVTDAALAPDGRHLAIRTYRDIWFFLLDDAGRPHTDPSRLVCDIAGVEPQGEGIDWWNDSTLVLGSEKGLFPAGRVTLVACPAR